MGAVDIGDRQLQNGEGPDARLIGNGIEEAAEMGLLNPLPRQPEAHVHGMYHLALRSLIHHQDGAVRTAARQDDELITTTCHGRLGTRTLTCRSRERLPGTGQGPCGRR